MDLLVFCPFWGLEPLGVEAACDRVAAAGYDGIEAVVPETDREARGLADAAASAGLALVAQVIVFAHDPPDPHRAAYERLLHRAAGLQPRFTNVHTGRDYYSEAENADLIGLAAAVAEASGVPVVHETHRGRFSYSAPATLGYLRRFPDLRLALDLSHWCVVAESLLEGHDEAVDTAIERADHVHARVGHAQAPQVGDPAAPEWRAALDRHLGWWDAVAERHRQRGAAALSVTPEFGPRPYLPALPGSQRPVADSWALNLWTADLLRGRFARSRDGAGDARVRSAEAVAS